MHSGAVYMWVVVKEISYWSFWESFQMCPGENQICFLQSSFIYCLYLYWRVRTNRNVWFWPLVSFFLRKFRRIVAVTIRWSKDTLLKEEYAFIIIIIMSHLQHGYPWPSPATLLYRPSLPVGLQGYILHRHRTVACRF